MYGFSKEAEEATVNTTSMGIKVDFNEGGIYEARVRENDKDKQRNDPNEYDLIPEDQIKQEKKAKAKMAFEASSDEDYRPKTKTKHGYKYDSFVEDTSSSET